VSRRLVFSRRIQLLGLLSVASGAPYAWVQNTMQFLLIDLGTSRAAVGFLSFVSYPWTLKFLWAPLVDRYALPWPGRRRSWVILAQLALALVLGALSAYAARALAARAAGTPLETAAWVVGLAGMAVAFLSATQDIALDAYAVEFLRPEEQAVAPGVRTVYYRLAMLLTGAVAISASDFVGWPVVLAATAALFLASVPLVLAAPEPEHPAAPPRSLARAVVEPFQVFFARPDALALGLFLFFYKFGDNTGLTMVNYFVKDLCFTNAEAGGAVKVVGTVALVAGTVLATALTARIGLGRSLWIFGVAQALAFFLYAAAALSRGVPLDVRACAALPPVGAATRAWTYLAIAAEYGTQAMAATAQAVLLLRVCDRRYAATQFALLTSLFGLGRWVAGLPSGKLVEWLGYPLFFSCCATVLALPGLWFLHRVAPLGSRDVVAPPAGP
jgi:PAT family beta-lactamase induction signal transducer AmpG